MISAKPAIASNEVIDLCFARDLFGKQYYRTAAYWVDGMLIDTGCAHTARQLLSVVGQWSVAQIVNTHSHEDHIGANAELQARFGCTIRAHALALPVLGNPRLQPLQPYRRLFWGWPKASKAEAIGEWVETENYRFHVIPTPGHSPDHIALFEPEQGWLFSGDAYIGGEDRALRAGYDIHGIIASLKRLSGLDVRVLFSGSGTVRSQGVQPILDKIAYLDSLGQEIGALRRQGLSPRRIKRRLFGREPAITYLTLGHFSGLRLVESYLKTPNCPPDEE
jgi:glyoxylase-like metal-dependent hydrolase (beta-lactamase superfamily II)